MALTPGERDRVFYLECSEFLQRLMRSNLAGEEKDRLIDAYYAVWLLAREGYLTMEWGGEAFRLGPTPAWRDRFGEFSMVRLAQIVRGRLESEGGLETPDDGGSGQTG